MNPIDPSEPINTLGGTVAGAALLVVAGVLIWLVVRVLAFQADQAKAHRDHELATRKLALDEAKSVAQSQVQMAASTERLAEIVADMVARK